MTTELREKVADLEARLSKQEQELARYKGFFGGIVAVFVAVGAFIEVVWPIVKGVFKH